MTNQELHDRRENLRHKTERVKGLHPMVAAGEMKAAAILMAEITNELARREINRGQICPEMGPECRGCPGCKGVIYE